ncbi:MAG: 4Fe-4S dicluster domain-containing protein [Bacteroidales bacterium]
MAWLVDYPREQVKWYPTIDLSKCVRCGMCMNCGKQVYTWTHNGPIVANPYSCVVGCTTCANLCKGEAISFPDVKELRDLYMKENLWAKVTKQLKQEGKLEPKD